MTEEDYVFTANGFRKVCNSLPQRLIIPLNSMKKIKNTTATPPPPTTTTTVLKKNKPLVSVYKSDVMDKYKMSETNGLQCRSAMKLSTARLTRRSPATPRDVIYSVRNPDCTPPHMYLHENVRLYAKHNRQQKQSITPRRRAQSADVAYRFGKPVRLPSEMMDNEHLTSEGLTMGQKQYIWGIARCYSVENMKKLNQRRTQSTLEYEFRKRTVTRDLKENTKTKLRKEYTEYKKFIEDTAKNGFVRTMSSRPCSRHVGNRKMLHDRENNVFVENENDIYHNSSSNSNNNSNNNDSNNNSNTETIIDGYDCVIILNSSPEQKNSKSFCNNVRQSQNKDMYANQVLVTATEEQNQNSVKPLQRPKSAFNSIRRQQEISSLLEEDLTLLTNKNLCLHDAGMIDKQESDQCNRL